jgi:hypothetical protein
MRDDEAQRREIPEQIALDELHERRRIGVDVVRASGVEIRIAGGADVHHRRHIEFHQLLIQRIPVAIGQRRGVPVATRGVRVEIAADETQVPDAPFELRRAVGGGHAWRLRQLAHADEIVRVQPHDAVDQIVAHAGPGEAGGLAPHVVRHRRSAWREDRQVRAAFTLQLQLSALEALADLIVADHRASPGRPRRILQGGDLRVAKGLQFARGGRVVAVAVDDHAAFVPRRDGIIAESRATSAGVAPRPPALYTAEIPYRHARSSTRICN